MIGQRFGRWTVAAEGEPIIRSYPGRPVHSSRRVVCRCDCGTEKECEAAHLKSGRSTSCGCLRKELVSRSKRKHGATVGGKTREYNIWKGMRQRCENPNNDDFDLYGGRGIKVCRRWKDFANFLADMGPRPTPQHSIDRYPNNDGDYEPTNCRWATPEQQANNKRPYKQREKAGLYNV